MYFYFLVLFLGILLKKEKLEKYIFESDENVTRRTRRRGNIFTKKHFLKEYITTIFYIINHGKNTLFFVFSRILFYCLLGLSRKKKNVKL